MHAPTEAPTEQRKAEYGEVIWPDFALAMFDGLRSAAAYERRRARDAVEKFSTRTLVAD